MTEKDLAHICIIDPEEGLPSPFIVQDKFVLLRQLPEEKQYFSTDQSAPTEKKLEIAGLAENSRKTIKCRVVGIPNFTRGAFAPGFALGDVVMVHPNVGNWIMLGGTEFKVARADEIVGFYELGPNDPPTAKHSAKKGA